LDNIGQVIKTIFENKPERFGKGKKSGLSAKVPGTCYERAFARRKDMVFDWFCERSIQRVPFFLNSLDGEDDDDENTQEE
jgi:hypothetical protein